VAVCAAIVAVAAVTGERGHLDVRRQRAQIGKLRAEVAALARENAALLAEVRGLRSDPFVIETLAREKLGYARPGEIVLRFPPADPPVADVPPPRAPSPGGR
jgi:cell division protein FtsB